MPRCDISGGYKVDVSRGTNVDRVSSEWFSRPDDERYLSLDDIFASVKGRAERSRTRTVESAAIRVEAHRDKPGDAGLVLRARMNPLPRRIGSLWPALEPCRCARGLSAATPAPLAGIKPAIRADQPPGRADQDDGGRGWPHGTARGDGPPTMAASTTMNWSRPCSGSQGTARATRAEGGGRCRVVLDWSTGIIQPARGRDKRRRRRSMASDPRRVSVPRR